VPVGVRRVALKSDRVRLPSCPVAVSWQYTHSQLSDDLRYSTYIARNTPVRLWPMVPTPRVPANNPPSGIAPGRILTQDPTLSSVCSPPQRFNPPAWAMPKTCFDLLESLASEQLRMPQNVVNALDVWSLLDTRHHPQWCAHPCYLFNASSNALASWRSAVSKPSVNQP